MQLGYFGRFAILFPVALGSALSGASVVHAYLRPDLVRDILPELIQQLGSSQFTSKIFVNTVPAGGKAPFSRPDEKH